MNALTSHIRMFTDAAKRLGTRMGGVKSCYTAVSDALLKCLRLPAHTKYAPVYSHHTVRSGAMPCPDSGVFPLSSYTHHPCRDIISFLSATPACETGHRQKRSNASDISPHGLRTKTSSVPTSACEPNISEFTNRLLTNNLIFVMRKNLLKTLLVAVGLVMGVNAWAEDVTTIYERGTTTNWTDTDISDWSGSSAIVTVNNGLAFSAGNTEYEYKKDVTTTENSLLKLTATWNTGSSTGRSGGYNYITFGDIEFRSYGQDAKGTISIAGTETTITTTKTDVRDGAVWNIEVTINKATKEVNYSITLPNNNKKTGKGLTNGVYDALKIGFHKPGKVTSTSQTLVNIELTETKQEIQTANYTVKFTDEENNEIKTADIRNGAVGNAINITEADKQSFKTSDESKKYIYESDDAENQTIAEDGSTTVTIKFREAATYHFTVYANVAGNKKQIDEGGEFEGETMYVNLSLIHI